MQPTGGTCCGEAKMRMPGCPMCEGPGCCPEHCCDWDTCDCECSAGREKYIQPSLDDLEHCPPCIEELVRREQEMYGGVQPGEQPEGACAEGPQAMPPSGPSSKRPSQFR